MGTDLRYVMRKMSDAEKIEISRNLYDVNRLTPYINRLHACFFGNLNYVDRLTSCVSRLHVWVAKWVVARRVGPRIFQKIADCVGILCTPTRSTLPTLSSSALSPPNTRVGLPANLVIKHSKYLFWLVKG